MATKNIKEFEEELVDKAKNLEKPKPSDNVPGFNYKNRKQVKYKITGRIKKPKSQRINKDDFGELYKEGSIVTMTEDPELEKLGYLVRVKS